MYLHLNAMQGEFGLSDAMAELAADEKSDDDFDGRLRVDGGDVGCGGRVRALLTQDNGGDATGAGSSSESRKWTISHEFSLYVLTHFYPAM